MNATMRDDAHDDAGRSDELDDARDVVSPFVTLRFHLCVLLYVPSPFLAGCFYLSLKIAHSPIHRCKSQERPHLTLTAFIRRE